MSKSRKAEIVIVDRSNIEETGFFCYMSRRKSEGYLRKLAWVMARLKEGMKIKMLKLPERGFIEYIPDAGGGFFRGPRTKPLTASLLFPPGLLSYPRPFLDESIYVLGFSYPVVPVGKSRIRVQVSAAHTPDQIAFALEKFRRVGKRLGAISAPA